MATLDEFGADDQCLPDQSLGVAAGGRISTPLCGLDPRLVDHDPLPVPGMRSGAAGLLDVVALIRSGLPDLSRTIEVQVGQGDLVACRFVDEGTHRGDLFGIAATGRRIRVAGINIERSWTGGSPKSGTWRTSRA